jgi:hypothetical protein
MDVVVVIRHPAAVVNSYKTLNWSQSFSDFLNQPLLMREHLAPFETEICEFAHNKFDIIDQIAFLWKLTHHVLLKYRQIRPNWIFVRHIDLAQEPISNFRCIFEKLQIPLDLNIERKIMAYSSSENSTQSTDLYSVKRDSRQVVWSWKNQLKLSEITRIRERVKDVSEAFYSEEEW